MSRRKENNQQSFYELLEDFLKIMETDYFVEVDRRLAKLSDETDSDNNGDVLNADQFILQVISYIDDYVDSATLKEIRISLYKRTSEIIELINQCSLTKKKLKELLHSTNVSEIISTTINYGLGAKYFTPVLIDALREECSKRQ